MGRQTTCIASGRCEEVQRHASHAPMSKTHHKIEVSAHSAIEAEPAVGRQKSQRGRSSKRAPEGEKGSVDRTDVAITNTPRRTEPPAVVRSRSTPAPAVTASSSMIFGECASWQENQ